MVKPFYLLDTSVISEGIKVDPNRHLMEKLFAKSRLSQIPSPVWHELVYGMNYLSEGALKELIRDYLMTVVAPHFSIMQYDDRAAWIHADIRARLEKQGLPAPVVACQIASIAVSNNMILVTKTPELYKTIAENSTLQIENWAL
ncbi:MAG: PIN domain-containing protein [Treponema sp.]|nr:PIN domain-containing protein [Treponema sp.]